MRFLCGSGILFVVCILAGYVPYLLLLPWICEGVFKADGSKVGGEDVLFLGCRPLQRRLTLILPCGRGDSSLL